MPEARLPGPRLLDAGALCAVLLDAGLLGAGLLHINDVVQQVHLPIATVCGVGV